MFKLSALYYRQSPERGDVKCPIWTSLDPVIGSMRCEFVLCVAVPATATIAGFHHVLSQKFRRCD